MQRFSIGSFWIGILCMTHLYVSYEKYVLKLGEKNNKKKIIKRYFLLIII